MPKVLNEKKPIFITGGLGYLGSALARAALQKGYPVVLYDALVHHQNHKDILLSLSKYKNSDNSLVFIRGETRNKTQLEKTIKKHAPGMLIHFGELVGVYACNRNPQLTRSANYYGSRNVVDVCVRNNIPLLYNSSSSIYGQQKKNVLMRENNPPPPPTDYYCKYKLLMEKYISQNLKKYKNFRAIIFRPATVCGVSPRMRLELLPNHFTYCAIAKGKIKIARGDSYRAIMDIHDLIKGYMKVIDRGEWKNPIYNIGHYNLTKIDCAKRIRALVPCSIINESNIGDTRNLMIDSSKFEKEFGYKPVVSFGQSIKQIARWVRQNKRQIEKNKFRGILNLPLQEWKRLI